MIRNNIFSILVALLIMYLSLAGSNTFEKVPVFKIPFFDKVMHIFMYFSLMSVIILENRKSLKSSVSLFYIAIIPLIYGILLEILQSTFSVNRSGSIYDVFANSAGILISVLVWLWIKPLIKESIK